MTRIRFQPVAGGKSLGQASRVTRGGPTGYIEVTGFLPRHGISNG